VAIFSGYSAVRLLLWMEVDSLLVAFVFACAIGALLGSFNAVLIHLFRLPTLIVTIGTASVFFGMMTLLVGTAPVTVSQMPRSMLAFADTTLFTLGSGSGAGRISVFVLIGAAALALTWFLLYRTSIGLAIFALGSNPDGARRAGFPILLTQVAIYAYVGVLAGAMCIVYFSNLRFVNPMSLVGTELPIIAAVVIGGAKITGGEGTLFGMLLGVVLIQLMNNTLVFLRVTTSLNNVVIGGVMLVSLSVLYLQERRRNQRLLRFVG
jgi:simple sugar transport system permease protein